MINVARYAHWLFPLVCPFLLLLLFRLLWWVAGADWSEPGMAAAFAGLFGFGGGIGLLIYVEQEVIKK